MTKKTLPPSNPETSSAVINAKTLLTTRYVPTFEELWVRGRGNIITFAQDWLDFDISDHPGQVKWVTLFPWAIERFLASGNRWGKTTIAAVKALHHTFYQTRHPKYAHMTNNYKVVNLSITADQALLAWQRAYMLAQQSKLLRRFVLEDETKMTPFPTMVMGYGKKGSSQYRRSIFSARSSARGAQYLLGMDFDFINWDEPAREPDGKHILDDVIRMRLADRNGRLDCTSTGDGRNWYFREFRLAERNTIGSRYAQTGPSYENPHIDHSRLRANERRMTSDMVEQNIGGGFAGVSSIFDRRYVRRCYAGVEYPILDEPEQIQRHPGAIYGGAVDFGNKVDSTVILIYEEMPGGYLNEERTYGGPRLIYAQQMHHTKWEHIYDTIGRVSHAFGHPPFLIDATAQAGDIHTEVLIDKYHMDIHPYQFAGRGRAKDHLITAGQQYVQKAIIRWPYIPDLYDEIVMYEKDDKDLATDWVMTYCLLCENHRRQLMPNLVTEDIPVMPLSLSREYTIGDAMPELVNIGDFGPERAFTDEEIQMGFFQQEFFPHG